MTDKTVSQTILNQLGGNRFIAMTGARNFGTTGNDLSFKIGRNRGKYTHCRIRLNSYDTYDLTFYRFWNLEKKAEQIREMVYADQLQTVFEAETGLRTGL